jgi:hypothetical protein
MDSGAGAERLDARAVSKWPAHVSELDSTEYRLLSPRGLIGIIAVFVVIGPIAAPLLFAAFFGTFGMLAMGPAAILVGFMYFFWWLPAVYTVFGPPYLLTGIFYAGAVRLFAPESLLTAMVAGAVAFPAFLGLSYWLTGTFNLAGTTRLGPDPLVDAWSILGFAAGVFACWWLVRHRVTSPRWY